jgi:hypothetical protein
MVSLAAGTLFGLARLPAARAPRASTPQRSVMNSRRLCRAHPEAQVTPSVILRVAAGGREKRIVASQGDDTRNLASAPSPIG